MTPGKFILVLVVVGVVLFAVNQALLRRSQTQSSDPEKSWVGRIEGAFDHFQKIDLSKDLQSDFLRDGQLELPVNSPVCKVTVRESDRGVRRAEFTYTGAGTFRVVYTPSPEDERAVKVDIDDQKPGIPVQLVFLEHGGEIVFTRSAQQSSALFKIR